MQAARPGVIHDREEIAAHAGHRRFGHRQNGGRCDGGVDRVPAFLQHAKTRGGCERLARGDETVACDHGRARVGHQRQEGQRRQSNRSRHCLNAASLGVDDANFGDEPVASLLYRFDVLRGRAGVAERLAQN